MADDIELKARISFETDPAKAAEAQKAVQGIKASAEGAAEAVNKVKPAPGSDKELAAAANNAQKGYQAINVAAAAAEGNIRGAGVALTSLASGFPKLLAALGPIGLVVGALSVLRTIIMKLQDAHDQLEASIRATRMAALEAQIKKNSEAYDKQREAIDRVADARQRLSDIEQAKDDALLRRQLAELELEKTKEKATLSPDDEIGARKVDLNYSEKRSALEEAAAQRKNEREATQIAASLSDMLDKRKAAQKQLDDLRKEYGALSERLDDITSKMGGRLFGMGWNVTSGMAAPELAEIDKMRKDLAEKAKKAAKDRDDADAPIRALRGMREAVETDRQTLGVQEKKRKVDDWVTGSGIDRDENARLDGLFQDLNAASADGSAVFRNWARQQIAAKERENALTVEFMQQMIQLAEQNARNITDATARARRPGG